MKPLRKQTRDTFYLSHILFVDCKQSLFLEEFGMSPKQVLVQTSIFFKKAITGWLVSHIFGIFTPLNDLIWRLHIVQMGWFNHQLLQSLVTFVTSQATWKRRSLKRPRMRSMRKIWKQPAPKRPMPLMNVRSWERRTEKIWKLFFLVVVVVVVVVVGILMRKTI